MQSRRFRSFYGEGPPRRRLGRCERCSRTIADCGFQHAVMCEHGSMLTVCCWCVVELHRYGVGGVVIGEAECPVVTLGEAAWLS